MITHHPTNKDIWSFLCLVLHSDNSPEYSVICIRRTNFPDVQSQSWFAYYTRARGVVVIVVGNGHGDTSSNPGRY